VFDHPDIKVWRSITERQNCTLEADLRWPPIRCTSSATPRRGFTTPADDESRGIRGASDREDPTVPLVGWGKLVDGRSFVITGTFAVFAMRKNCAKGWEFERILEPTADLAASARCGLHHAICICAISL